MRVLVTGSRNWDAKYQIDLVLNELYALADVLGSQLTLINGDCATGADHLANLWADGRPDVVVQRYPANWKRYGKAAGPRRNEEMVDAGADMCVAFLKDNSIGTRQTIALARIAKIPTYVIDNINFESVTELLSSGPG